MTSSCKHFTSLLCLMGLKWKESAFVTAAKYSEYREVSKCFVSPSLRKWENRTNKLNTSDFCSLSYILRPRNQGLVENPSLYYQLVKQTCNLRQANKKTFKIYLAVPPVKKFQSHYCHQERVKRHRMCCPRKMSSKV